MTKDQDRLWEIMLQYHAESTAAHNRIAAELGTVRQEIAALRVKAGAWGLVAGIIPGTIVLLVMVISKLI
jgi:hypothetical protein